MLTQLTLKLKGEEPLSYQMSSRFHGFMMEQLPRDYGEVLHRSQLHPYSQYLEKRENQWYWVVQCLTKEAAEIIIEKGLSHTDEIVLNNRNTVIKVTEKKYQSLSMKEIAEEFYWSQCSRIIRIRFVTPTAFKQKGAYLFFPDIRCIYQSLMNKYDAVVTNETMMDEDTLNYFCDNTLIIGYDIKSVFYHLEHIKIPAFIGSVTFRITGSQTMVNFANALFCFGEYSGIGIKTSLGMGAIHIIKREGNHFDRKTDKTDRRQSPA